MLFRSKLNSIESTMSKALLDNEINHEDFTTIINRKKYRELERSNIEGNKLTEDGKRIGIDEIIKQNERTDNNLKSQL